MTWLDAACLEVICHLCGRQNVHDSLLICKQTHQRPAGICPCLALTPACRCVRQASMPHHPSAPPACTAPLAASATIGEHQPAGHACQGPMQQLRAHSSATYAGVTGTVSVEKLSGCCGVVGTWWWPIAPQYQCDRMTCFIMIHHMPLLVDGMRAGTD